MPTWLAGLDWPFFLEALVRLLLAAILGGFIGFERETENKPAGFRTNMLVCIGSALVMITSEFVFQRYSGQTSLDPTRLGAQVISGIGFLGAGTIIRDGLHVRGLTTAASMWVVACVGLAVGIGFYAGAIISTLFIYLILIAMKKLQEHIKVKNHHRVLVIRTQDQPGQLGAIGSVFGKFNISIRNIELIRSEDREQELDIKLFAQLPAGVALFDLMTALQQLPGISRVAEE